jgi:3-oxoadipate enol-lactonase
MSAGRTFTTTDGVRLAFTVDDYTDPWRRADAVVLLHAAMSNKERFYAWVPTLARHFRVVRVDGRGHGDSEAPGPDKPISIDRLAQDVVELLDHLGLDRAHVSGSSAGGYAAQWLAITRPARVDKLALFSTTPGFSYHTPEARYPTWIPTIRAKGVDGLLRDTAGTRVDPSTIDPGFISWMVSQAGRMDREFTCRFLEMIAQLDIGDRMHEIKAPTLVVVPGADVVCRKDGYERLRRIPNHRWVVYDGMAHNITNGAPERCAGELKEFLLSR